MRKPFIAGNWKMNLSLESSKELVKQLQQELSGVGKDEVDVAVCPPFLYLADICRQVSSEAQDGVAIKVGAQNMHWEEKGAFTGEVAPNMLTDIGCTYVILGHSERRAKFHETDENVSKKALAAFAKGLLPIICIGETLEEREAEKTLEVVTTQLKGSLAGLTPSQVEAVTLAYEPVWAIGTGKAATPEMAQEVHQAIRKYLTENYGNSVAENTRIQYGGSVKPENVKELMAQPDIDGALVGGASLKVDSFSKIVKFK